MGNHIFDRREFLRRARAAGPVSAMALGALCLSSRPGSGSRARAAAGEKMQRQIRTVQGPIAADVLGTTLIHEHVKWLREQTEFVLP